MIESTANSTINAISTTNNAGGSSELNTHRLPVSTSASQYSDYATFYGSADNYYRSQLSQYNQAAVAAVGQGFQTATTFHPPAYNWLNQMAQPESSSNWPQTQPSYPYLPSLNLTNLSNSSSSSSSSNSSTATTPILNGSKVETISPTINDNQFDPKLINTVYQSYNLPSYQYQVGSNGYFYPNTPPKEVDLQKIKADLISPDSENKKGDKSDGKRTIDQVNQFEFNAELSDSESEMENSMEVLDDSSTSPSRNYQHNEAYFNHQNFEGKSNKPVGSSTSNNSSKKTLPGN